MSMPGLASSTANLVSPDTILQMHHCCKLGLAQTKSIAIGLKTCKQAKAFFGPKYRDYCHLDCPERLLKIFFKTSVCLGCTLHFSHAQVLYEAKFHVFHQSGVRVSYATCVKIIRSQANCLHTRRSLAAH